MLSQKNFSKNIQLPRKTLHYFQVWHSLYNLHTLHTSVTLEEPNLEIVFPRSLGQAALENSRALEILVGSPDLTTP